MLSNIVKKYTISPHHKPSLAATAGAQIIAGYIGFSGGLFAGYIGISIAGGKLKYAFVPACIGCISFAGAGWIYGYFTHHHSRQNSQKYFPHLALAPMRPIKHMRIAALCGVFAFDAAMFLIYGESTGALTVGCAMN